MGLYCTTIDDSSSLWVGMIFWVASVSQYYTWLRASWRGNILLCSNSTSILNHHIFNPHYFLLFQWIDNIFQLYSNLNHHIFQSSLCVSFHIFHYKSIVNKIQYNIFAENVLYHPCYTMCSGDISRSNLSIQLS